MTQKFTTPCFIRKNTKKLRNKLKKLGYKPSLSVNIKEPYLWTNKDGIYFSSHNHLSREKGECITLYGIFCQGDEDLFLALAALNESNDYMQWFVDKRGVFVQCKHRQIQEFVDIAAINGYDIGGDWLRKATVEEIIEHFKD